MKRLVPAFVLLGSAALAQAADLTMTVTTDPPPPWSVTEPVTLRLTITNHANVPRRGWFEIRDIDRAARLVDRIRLRPASAAGMDVNGNSSFPCATFSPNYDNVLTWCDTTVPILPGDSLTIDYDVMAFPNAVGYREAYYELYPMTADTSVPVPGALSVQIPVRFAYGFLPHQAVPAGSLYWFVALAGLLFSLGSVVLRGRRTQGGRTP